MADPKLDAVIEQLKWTKIQLMAQAPLQADKDKIEIRINKTILNIKLEERQAIAAGNQTAFYEKVEGLANGFQAMTQASIGLAGAIKSGDPFAISASSLDLATSLISTISLAGGPVGAAAGAVLGAILSIISMILKMFQAESESLISQIEQVSRKLQAETKIDGLGAASDHLTAFTKTGIKAYAEKIKNEGDETEVEAEEADEGNTGGKKKKYTYADILLSLNQNAQHEIMLAKQWLVNPLNQELERWGEALGLLCRAYASFKVGVAYWLPVIKQSEVHKLTNWKDGYDEPMLSFLEAIKPVARNRGIICHAGLGGIFVRDIVFTNKKSSWTNLTGKAYGIAGTYRPGKPGQQPSSHPAISILHLGGTETFDSFSGSASAWMHSTVQEVEQADHRGNTSVRSEILKVKLHPFSKKTLAYDNDGHWPLASDKWDHLTPIEKDGGAYDIWAIPGSSPGEIDVYTATGGDVRLYTEKGGDEHIKLTRRNPVAAGYKVGAVRAVRPKTLPEENKKALEGYTEAVYELCEDGKDTKDYPFKIWVFFMSGSKGPLDGAILPPRPLLPKDWRNFPVGIAVDSLRFWVFSKFFIACASHTNVKEHLEKNKEAMPDWMVYYIPSDVLGYDPRERVSMGLLDLSACDDGTLTAVFEGKDGWGRIFTATPRFEGGKLIIDGKDVDGRDHETTTHGWSKDPDPGTYARRVHKLPILCWPILEELVNALKPE
jgi:hypothetical protein